MQKERISSKYMINMYMHFYYILKKLSRSVCIERKCSIDSILHGVKENSLILHGVKENSLILHGVKENSLILHGVKEARSQ